MTDTDHAVNWRDEAIAGRAMLADCNRALSDVSTFVRDIGQRLGATAVGYGGQTVEAGEARYRAGIAKRIDEVLAREAALMAEVDRLSSVVAVARDVVAAYQGSGAPDSYGVEDLEAALEAADGGR